MNTESKLGSNYFRYSHYLKSIFDEKTYKITLTTDNTCPTRDQSLGFGGCTFCDLRGSASFHAYNLKSKSINEQIRIHLEEVKQRFNSKKHIAYFQAYTNTYDSFENLKTIFQSTLHHPEIFGISIGTRPDCLDPKVLVYLEELAQKHYINLEIGAQTFHDPTLEWYKRGHSANDTELAMQKISDYAPNVHVCMHLMFGAPTDPCNIAIETANKINSFKNIKGVKLHQLMVLKKTQLAYIYKKNSFKTITLEEYISLVCNFIEHLRPDIYIERLAAKPSLQEECISPEWCCDYRKSINQIDQFIISNNIRQGKYCKSA